MKRLLTTLRSLTSRPHSYSFDDIESNAETDMKRNAVKVAENTPLPKRTSPRRATIRPTTPPSSYTFFTTASGKEEESSSSEESSDSAEFSSNTETEDTPRPAPRQIPARPRTQSLIQAKFRTEHWIKKDNIEILIEWFATGNYQLHENDDGCCEACGNNSARVLHHLSSNDDTEKNQYWLDYGCIILFIQKGGQMTQIGMIVSNEEAHKIIHENERATLPKIGQLTF